MRARTRSGLMGERSRLRRRYDSLAEFRRYSGMYGLHRKLGYKSAKAAWAADPMVESSVDPRDFRKVSKARKVRRNARGCSKRRRSLDLMRRRYDSLFRQWAKKYRRPKARKGRAKRRRARNPRHRYQTRGVGGRYLQVPEQHQLRIARDTLRMNDVMARVMGGMTKAEARAVIARLTGRKARGNPGGGINDVRPGDTIKYLVHAGRGRGGPEYKPAQGRVYMRGPYGWVAAQKGRSASPNVVDGKNFLGIVRRGR